MSTQLIPSLLTAPSSPAATAASVASLTSADPTSAAPVSTSPSPSSTSSPSPSSSPSPTSAPPTTSSQQTATSNVATSSSLPPSSSLSSATTAPSSTTPTSAPTSVAPATSQFLTSSGAVVETVTTVVTPSVTSTSTPANNTSSSNSFWHNTGAVAGVFTVVGLVAVAILVALVTNAVRRRRAQKFDRDVAEAAAEAAASSRPPFDDYSYHNTSPGGAYGYSENSHGTFRQAPMSTENDTYGMSEMSRYDPYAAGAAGLTAAAVESSRMRKDTLPGAPGIAGVGAGNLGREPSRRDPYHAFAGPGPQPHEMMDNAPYMRGTTNQDVLEAAGLAGAGAATMADNGAFINRRPSDYTQHTHRSGRSNGYGSPPPENYPTQAQYGYQPEGYPQRADTRSADPFAAYGTAPYPQPMPSPGLPNPHGTPSPSPPGNHSDGPFGGRSAEGFHEDDSPSAPHEEARASYQDEDDDHQGNRVLRVANQ